MILNNSTFQIDETVKEKFRMINILGEWGAVIDLDFHINVVVPNEVVKYLNNSDWENITLDKANQLRQEVLIKDKDVFCLLWNKYSADARNFVKSELIGNISLKFSQDVVDCVRWDLIHLVLYFQYKLLLNINIISFYEEKFLIYREGHFPCGWIGNYPNGNFLVV